MLVLFMKHETQTLNRFRGLARECFTGIRCQEKHRHQLNSIRPAFRRESIASLNLYILTELGLSYPNCCSCVKETLKWVLCGPTLRGQEISDILECYKSSCKNCKSCHRTRILYLLLKSFKRLKSLIKCANQISDWRF